VYGVSKDEAEKQIDRFAGSLESGRDDVVPGSRPTMERKN
jgi:hypothetical protein